MSTSKDREKRGRTKTAPDPRWIAFGKRIADLRRDRGWMAYEVAKLIEVDPATISQLENGRRATGPEQTTLTRLAELFGVSTDSLLGSEAPRSDPKSGTPRRTSPAGADVDHRAAIREAIEPDHLRAALYDALLAFFADIFEAVSESRTRATQDATGETRGRLAPTASERTHRH